jgi:hypothetical protein
MLKFQTQRVKKQMESIAMLIGELPMVMAPASLIAALLAATLIKLSVRLAGKPVKIMAVGVISALTAGTVIMQYLQ